MKSRRIFAIAVLATLAAFPLALFAHHSRAHYGTDETSTTGTVIEYKWRNPHVTLVWEVKGKAGEITHWVGELSSVTTMISDGMTKDSLKQGEEIEVIACPSMNPGSTEAWVRTIKKADGTVVVDSSRGACTPS